MNPPTQPASDEKPSPKALIQSFQAYLRLAITAGQTGQIARLARLPGPKLLNYCRALAQLPDNVLARELANSVLPILKQIENLAADCQGPLYRKEVRDAATEAELKRILEQLDFALAFILRSLLPLVHFRAQVTQAPDLLLETFWAAKGNGVVAAKLIRRYQQLFPGDDPPEEGESLPDLFAWEAYQRVALLDDLADEFPDHVRTAAREMNAWPMLVHRHTNNRRRFDQLARRLELGAEYPIDASEGARYRPDTPLVRYLIPLVHRLHVLRCNCAGQQPESAEQRKERLRNSWWEWPDEEPSDELVEVLCAARQLPPLSKATANEWAEQALVPLILATDARDWEKCDEPALKRIANQKGVKSRATFKSRLLAAVASTLRRLARPA